MIPPPLFEAAYPSHKKIVVSCRRLDALGASELLSSKEVVG